MHPISSIAARHPAESGAASPPNHGHGLRDGGVEVVGVEHDACHDPSVGIDLEDVKDVGAERIVLRAGRGPRIGHD